MNHMIKIPAHIVFREIPEECLDIGLVTLFVVSIFTQPFCYGQNVAQG